MNIPIPPFQTVITGFTVAMVGFFSSFTIVLHGLAGVGADTDQAASGLMAAALSMGLAGMFLSYRFRMPVSAAWSTPGAALLVVAGSLETGFAEAVAGFLVAGLLTVVAGLCRPIARLAESIPAELAQGMLGGVLLSICLAPVNAMIEAPLVIAPVIISWLVVGRLNRLMAVPGAVAVAALVILLTADMDQAPVASPVIQPEWTIPVFSAASVVGIGIPLFIVTMATQNIPGIAVVRSCGYRQDAGSSIAAVGIFSILSAPFGALSTCLAAITAAMCAGDESHPDKGLRYWSAIVAGAFYCILGLSAGVITWFASLAPPMLLASVAGMALLGVLANSLATAFGDSKYRDPAAVTFLVTASGITLLGLGAPVWGLLAGGFALTLRELGRGRVGFGLPGWMKPPSR
ncbi:MAG: benzoate/H(+) symporter BenE family transporter [Roseovarius sp.]|nr:benzoate/H(+) symporter BenE family transporter [Roseovarius sp.]